MKLIPHLKKGLSLYIKEVPMLIASFLIFPISLAFIYGGMQEDLFEGRHSSIEAAEVEFQYDRSSEKGVVLNGILSNESVKELIHANSGNAEYHVLISEDFKEAEIKCEDKGTMQFAVLKNFTETVLNDFNEYDLVHATVNSLELNETQKSTLINNIMNTLNENGGLAVKENIVEGYKTLTSAEYYTISMFSFTSLLLIVTLAGYFYKEVKEGIVKRTLSTPNARIDYFIGFILNTFIASAAISALYVIINRARGIAFAGNMLSITVVILLQSLLCASAAGIVIAFIKKEMTASVVMNIVLVVPSVFGGVFFYNEIIESEIMKAIINAVPNALILNSYKNLAITGSLQEALGDLIVMAILSVVFLLISIVKIQRKWEV